MGVYAKIEYNNNLQKYELIPAYNGYNGIVGLAESPELCLANGFTEYTTDEISGYNSGSHIINAELQLEDISSNVDYITAQKNLRKSQLAKEYASKFSEFDTMWSRNVNLGKKTTAQYTTARSAMQAELLTKLSEV